MKLEVPLSDAMCVSKPNILGITLKISSFDFFFREKESFTQEKKDIDNKFNDVLRDCKRHGYVTDMVFQKVQENVGIKSDQQENVFEPILATKHYISYQSVEANRQEVK